MLEDIHLLVRAEHAHEASGADLDDGDGVLRKGLALVAR